MCIRDSAWTKGRLGTYMRNGLVICLLKVPLGILVESLAAFAITRLDIKHKTGTVSYTHLFLTEDPNDCRMYLYNGTCAMIIDSPTMASQIMIAEQDASLYSFFAFPTESNGCLLYTSRCV